MKFHVRLSASRIVPGLLLATLLTTVTGAQEPGDTVVVTIDYDTKIETRKVDKVYAGSVHRMIDARGKWCALQDVKGWLPRQYCLSVPTAMKLFTRRIAQNKEDYDAWMTRGMLYLEQGDLKSAFRDIDQSLRINPKRASFWNNRGMVYMRMNQFDLAIQDVNKAIELAPNYANAFNNRGMCNYAKGEFVKSVEDYSQAIRLQPDYPMFYVNRAVSLHSSGKPREALDDYNAALRLRKNIAEAWIGRSNVYLGLNDLDRAMDNASEAIRLDPQSPEAYNNRGWIRYKTGDFERAHQDFNKSIQLDDEFPKAFSNLGVMLTEQKKYDTALKMLNKAVQLDEFSPLSYTNRANAHLGLGQFKKARADFNKALDLAPKDAETLNGKAWFLATCPRSEFRDGKLAVELATAACQASEMRNWSHVDTLAAAHAENGDFQQAISFQQTALELAPQGKKPACRQRLENYQNDKPSRSEAGQR